MIPEPIRSEAIEIAMKPFISYCRDPDCDGHDAHRNTKEIKESTEAALDYLESSMQIAGLNEELLWSFDGEWVKCFYWKASE